MRSRIVRLLSEIFRTFRLGYGTFTRVWSMQCVLMALFIRLLRFGFTVKVSIAHDAHVVLAVKTEVLSAVVVVVVATVN